MKHLGIKSQDGEVAASQTEHVASDDYLASAINAIQDAQVSVRRYMKQRTAKQLANAGLLMPLRMLKEVESKLKTYVKN